MRKSSADPTEGTGSHPLPSFCQSCWPRAQGRAQGCPAGQEERDSPASPRQGIQGPTGTSGEREPGPRGFPGTPAHSLHTHSPSFPGSPILCSHFSCLWPPRRGPPTRFVSTPERSAIHPADPLEPGHVHHRPSAGQRCPPQFGGGHSCEGPGAGISLGRAGAQGRQ